MTANPIKPSRYRPGKAAQEEASSSEASENEGDDVEDHSEAQDQQQQKPKPAAPPRFQSGKTAAAAASNLKNLNLEERRKAEVARDRAAKEEERRERERLEREAGFVTESESGSEEDEGEDDDQDEGEAAAQSDRVPREAPLQQAQKQAPQRRTGSTSSNEESSGEEGSSSEESSESDAPDPRLKRPIFVRKADRQSAPQPQDTTAPASTPTPQAQSQAQAPNPATEDEAARRKTEQTNALIQITIDARLAASAAASAQWDDEAPTAELDDTDGLDPELEHAEWVARELARLKRSRAALEEREAEIAEVERRRNLSTPEREREDRERIAEQEREREGKKEAAKGTESYMRRYHHKGAFSAGDEEKEAELRQRDLMTAEYEEDVRMKGALPQYLQARDSSMIGRKGRQRHRDLRSEDTGRWGGSFGGGGRAGRDAGGKSAGGRGDYANEPLPEDERFRPDRPGDVRGATGANAGALGERKRPYGQERQREDDFKRPRREQVR